MSLSPYILPGIPQHKEIRYAEIARATLKHFKLSWKEVNSKSRKMELVYCRQVIMFLMRTHTKMTLKQIAAVFTLDYDHTTVLHHVKYIKGKLQFYQHVRDDIDIILNKL
jgi:chromosomal replication initiator protein